jgi:N-methylhydantoinase B
MTETIVASHAVDPVTFEVIRHRLLAITDEQGAALQAISGSPHVTEANDFNVGLYLPSGRVAAMGRTILIHAAAMASITRFVIADCTDAPGICEGDMFVVNNPWKGAVHAQDMGLVAPIYYRGELLAWTSAMCHMVDVGGTRPGSFCADAFDCYAEGLQLPPVKLVDAGHIRSDVWQLIMSHTRMANTVDLDLRGLVGANNTAVRAMVALADKYGADTVRAVMAGLIELSEHRLRARLRELPDARIRTSAYLDNEGGSGQTYEIDLVLTKQGESLRFDYSGSSPQAPVYINCTRSGLMAGVASAVLPTLAYDAPWNDGLFAPLDVHAPEGLICNARRPAPVSGGLLEAGWLVEVTAVECLSKLAACSPELMREAQAAPAGGPDQFVLSGTTQHGEPFTHVIFDCIATGGGAYEHRDGVWTQGQHNIERLRISNVETTELEVPVLYLSRGLIADTGGAGRNRGGQSIGSTYLFRGSDHLLASCSGHGWEIPNSIGIFGGYPGAENDRQWITDGDVAAWFERGVIPSPGQITGTRPAMHGRQGLFRLGAGQVISNLHQAGGGWGDPLERSLDDLERDVIQGSVTEDAAGRLYGAVVVGGMIDRAASLRRREEIRAERRGWPSDRRCPGIPADAEREVLHPIGDRMSLARIGDARFVVCACTAVLGPAGEPWRCYAGCEVSRDVHAVTRSTRLGDGIEIRRYACPGCGVLHATDVTAAGRPHLDDIEFLEPGGAS